GVLRRDRVEAGRLVLLPCAEEAVIGLAGHRDQIATQFVEDLDAGLCHGAARRPNAVDLRVSERKAFAGLAALVVGPLRVDLADDLDARMLLEYLGGTRPAVGVDGDARDTAQSDDLAFATHGFGEELAAVAAEL